MHANNYILRSGRSSFSLLLLFLCALLAGSCTTDGERRYWADVIAEADSMNRNYVPMTSDSLLIDACEFYDRHGSPNERMKAHYLLGCVYRDMGEAPRAIESYQDAVACADTTDAECDFQKLGCVYSQMGIIYHKLLLLSEEIESRRLASHFFFVAKDTIGAIYEYRVTAGAYILMNKSDSAEVILKRAINLYNTLNRSKESVASYIMLMHIYVNLPERIQELKTLIDKYESDFCNHRELPSSKRQYYYYKGKYFEFANQLDSAEFYYRKIYRSNMKPVQKDPMYRGLLSVFQTRHQSDSIAKYAKLLCEANDSSIAIKDQDLTAQVAASYNYAHYQKQSLDNERKAYHRLLLVFILLVLFLLGFISAVIFRNRYKDLAREKKAELEKMDIEHRHVIELMRQEQDDLLSLQEQRYQELSEEKNTSIQDLQQKLEKYSDLRQHYSPETLEERLHSSSVFKKLKEKVLHPGSVEITNDDWVELRNLFNEELPRFFGIVNSHKQLNATEYNMCMLIRLGFQPKELLILLDMQPGYNITMYRSRLLKKAFNTDESAKELDRLILNIK